MIKLSIRCVLGKRVVTGVHLGVHRSFGMKDRVLLGCDAQFFVICMAPNLLHVVPVSDDAVLDGMLEVENTPFCLGFISSTSVSDLV